MASDPGWHVGRLQDKEGPGRRSAKASAALGILGSSRAKGPDLPAVDVKHAGSQPRVGPARPHRRSILPGRGSPEGLFWGPGLQTDHSRGTTPRRLGITNPSPRCTLAGRARREGCTMHAPHLKSYGGVSVASPRDCPGIARCLQTAPSTCPEPASSTRLRFLCSSLHLLPPRPLHATARSRPRGHLCPPRAALHRPYACASAARTKAARKSH